MRAQLAGPARGCRRCELGMYWDPLGRVLMDRAQIATTDRLSVWQRRVTRLVTVVALGRGRVAEDILFRHRTKWTVLILVVERQCPLFGPAVQPEREASGQP